MTSKISYNVLMLPDRGKLFTHARRLKPAAMLFYSHMGGTAQEFAAEFPNCATILRFWPDGEIHKQFTPEAWLNKVSGGIPASIYLYTTNEAGWSRELIQWHTDLVKLAIARKRRLCILNMGAGQPAPEEWEQARELITLASQHRDLIILGLHQYGGAVISSGLVGGTPTLIQPGQWPSPSETRDMTRWHIGRQKFLIDQCKKWAIEPPRIVITEAGFDFLGDIGDWINSLKFTPPNTSVNGWKTLADQWSDWWPTWDAQTAYAEQLLWARDALWNDVEAVLLFGWGDSGGWEAYRVDEALTLQQRLETAPAAPPLPPAPPPVTEPTLPIDLGVALNTRITGDNWILRAEPTDSGARIGLLIAGEEIRMYPATATLADGMSWKVIERVLPVVSEARRGWTAYPTPVSPPDTPPPTNSTAEGDIRRISILLSQRETLRAEIERLDSEILAIASLYLPTDSLAA